MSQIVKPQNPFLITEDYVSSDYFCDRERETELLRDNIVNGRNTVLISPRRMGKTGLIAHTLDVGFPDWEYNVFCIDLYSTSCLSEMVMLLSREITGRSAGSVRGFIETFVSVVKSLRPGVKYNQFTGELEFNLSLGEIARPEVSMEEIFAFLEGLPGKCIVAIDEFQQIADYPERNVIALLRTCVQRSRNCRFIFAGSRRRMMEKLFSSPSEPFYQSCVPLYLEAIDREKYRVFAQGLFSDEGKGLSAGCFDRIYDCFEGHTWYVQLLLNEVFSRTPAGRQAGEEMFGEVLEYVVKLSGKTFEEQFVMYSESQKALLIAIAKEGRASSMTSVAFVRRHALKSPSTVQSAARALYDNEVITREGDEYRITNRLFSFWLAGRYGNGIQTGNFNR